tara:strand:- start:5988 stop:6932 length:945 start_codon:yes stop_codon:yes gene_type:complete
MNYDDFLWCEKYRPKKVSETILPKDLKNTFQAFVDQKNIPNLLLSGPPGCGKTTVAKAICSELDSDYIVINGSNEGRSIDVLRLDIQNFASSVSFSGGRKYVIIDEADYLNPNSVQPALRNFMEEYSSNCGFILTCNYKNKIIEPLQSRCSSVNFKILGKEKESIALEMFKRIKDILKIEEIEYEEKVLAELLSTYFPDWRKLLNELQKYSVSGKIDVGILSNWKDETLTDLMKLMKTKDYDGVRKWVNKNNDIDVTVVFNEIYTKCKNYVHDKSIPGIVVTLAEYQYKHAFVANPEINLMACLTTLMYEADFK